jgi:rhodanese-related sulfurtransferase
MNAFAEPEIEVTAEQTLAALQEGRAQIVDIREPYEHEAGHIEGERLASNAERLDRDRPVIFYCRLGARSAMATQAFRAAGWDAYSMRGGLGAWEAAGLPIAPEGGGVAPH